MAAHDEYHAGTPEEALRESEERYRSLFDRSLQCVYINDFEGNFLDANPFALELLGYEREEIAGLNYTSLMSEDQLPAAMEGVKEILETGAMSNPIELKLRRKDGGIVYIESLGSILYREGEPYALLAIARDITGRKAAEEALRESEERYRLIYESTGVATYTYGIDMKFTSVNRMACELIGYEERELLGRNILELGIVHPDDFERAAGNVQRLFEGEMVRDEFRFIKKDGSIIIGDVAAAPLLNQDGEIAAFINAAMDITERKQMEEAFKEGEEKYRYLTESMNDIAWTLDLEMNPTYVSPAIEKVLGFTVEERTKQPLAKHITPETMQLAMEVMGDELLNDKERDPGRSISLELDFYHKDGSVRCLETLLSFIRDGSGNPAGIYGLSRDVTGRRQAEEERERLLGELGERIKELDCVYGLSRLVERPGITLDGILQGTAELIPPSWHYPDITCARVVFNEREFKTDNFRETGWKQSADVEVGGVKKGAIEVYLTEEMPHAYEGPFLEEERLLLGTLAERLGRVTERIETGEALRRSEAKFHTLWDSSSDAVMLLDEEGFFDCNQATLRTFGCASREEFCSKHPADLSPPEQPGGSDSLTLANQRIAVAMKEGSNHFEWVHRRADSGEDFPADVLLSAMELDGKPVVQAVVRDITERKRTEEALRESEERFRQFADNLPEIVFEADALGRFVYVNRNALEVFGYEEEELYAGSVNVMEMLAEEDRERAALRMRKILSEGAQGSNEYTARRKDGSVFPVIISTIAVVRDGIAVGLRGVLTDTTAQKEAREALERANRELEGFARTVSHDLKGPLAGVVSGGELMRLLLARPWREETAQQVLEVAGVMQANGENAIELIDNILDLAQAGSLPQDIREVPVGGVLKRVLEERRLLIEKKGVKVEAGGELGRVHASPTHIYQLFANLVGNAVKYNDNPGPWVEVKYLEEGAGEAHRYLVRDNGPGIPEEALERVFDPFFKGDGGGTGIGLAIVEKIVKAYGGSIRAYNDNGACFEFTLRDYAGEEGGPGRR